MIAHPLHPDHDMGRIRFHKRAFEVGDHPRKWRGEARWWKAFFAALLLFAGTTRAALPEESTWRAWLEPSFTRAPGAEAIAGAKQTQMAFGSLTPLGLQALTRAEVAEAGDAWAAFQARARQNAAADLAKTQVEYVRNKQKTIEYAVVRSDQGLAASAVLTPKFLQQFEDTLGPDVVLMVPNRSTAWVFPKLVTTWQDYTGAIVEAYHATAWPVSLEIFELGPDGLKAIGLLSDPARD